MVASSTFEFLRFVFAPSQIKQGWDLIHPMIPCGNRTGIFTAQYMTHEETEHVVEFRKQLPKASWFQFLPPVHMFE